ncbi:AmmeMemoRadiSam system protein A, partial [Candidatus Parcubacteria bacterium]|nr:AmmeMemoRadiSam system protein A [Candidatus Parcubacteria bacterium]
AKNTIETYIKTGKKIVIPENLPEEFYNCQKGVFVTIYKKSDDNTKKELRGCIGTFMPTKENVAQEIIDNAISAAIHDYRFNPITENELDSLQNEISLLSSPEQIDSVKSLNAKKYGVIVKSQDGKTGLLLPDIDEVDIPKHQIEIACQKAGIDLNREKIELFRFTVDKYNLAS